MNAEIILKTQSIGLTKQKRESEVQTFLDVHGDDTTLRALDMAEANMKKIARTGMNAGTGLKSWRWATKKIVADAERNEIQGRLDEEKKASTAAYQATIKKGYMPNQETLLAQIEGQYTDGLIAKREYEYGMIGIRLVFGYVAVAKELTEDEEGMEEFRF